METRKRSRQAVPTRGTGRRKVVASYSLGQLVLVVVGCRRLELMQVQVELVNAAVVARHGAVFTRQGPRDRSTRSLSQTAVGGGRRSRATLASLTRSIPPLQV